MTTSTISSTTTRIAGPSRRTRRLGAVLVAVAAPTILYVIGDSAGVEFTITDPGASEGAHFEAYQMAMFGLFFGLLGWGLLAVLERFTAKATTIWIRVAVAVTLLSFVPIFVEKATAGTHSMLVLIHLAVAAPLIAWLPLRRTR